jgi:hypothetical protein
MASGPTRGASSLAIGRAAAFAAIRRGRVDDQRLLIPEHSGGPRQDRIVGGVGSGRAKRFQLRGRPARPAWNPSHPACSQVTFARLDEACGLEDTPNRASRSAAVDS